MALWKNEIKANRLVEFLPLMETRTDIKTISKVRDKLDEWGKIGFGVLRIPDFGSRIKIEQLLSGTALFCEVNILSVSREAIEKSEPFSGNIRWEMRPKSLQTLPFSPPPKYENFSEPSSIIPGSSEKIICKHCNGHKALICGRCDGNRIVACSLCDGTGKVERYESYAKRKGGRIVLRQCSLCGGAKAIICSKCDGTGMIKCRECKGMGAFRHYELMNTEYDVETRYELFSRMSDYPEAFLKEKGKGEMLWNGDLFEKMKIKNESWHDAEKKLGKYSPALEYIASKQPPLKDKRMLFDAWFRWGAKIENFSYYRVKYNYSGHPYVVYLIGDDLHVHASVLPPVLSRLFSFAFSNIRKMFLHNDEEAITKALILAALYMAWADGKIQEAEKERLRDWIDQSKLSQSTKNDMVKYLRKPLKDLKIAKYVHQPEDAEKILQIAWQSAVADGVIEESENQAFLKMAKDLSLNDKSVTKIKELAMKEMGLTSTTGI